MYLIKIDGNKDLYYPGDEECVVSSAKLHEEIGAAGSLEITVPAVNPYYDSMHQRRTELSVYKDDRLIFNGEIREISEDFLKNKNVYAVGELSYLKDSFQGLKKFEATRAAIFQSLISSHNSQVEARKRFTAGAVGLNPNVNVKVISEYNNTFDVLKKLCDNECYFRIRHENNTRYIDIMPIDSYGVRSEQYIEFSENLMDYAMSSSTEELATAVIPLGQSLDDSPVEDTTAYMDIKTNNHSDWDTPDSNGFVIHDDYVYSQTAVSNFGWIKKAVHFNVLNTRAALITAAKNWLKQNQFEKFSYELTAFDLSTIDAQADDYSVGDYIRCISEPHGMDAWLPVREREIDLLNLANNTLKVGAEGQKSLTQSISSQITALAEEMPDESEILKAALKNASNLINANGDNGYVVLSQNAEGKLYEILIMNAPSIEQSTKAWRWNLSGFGYGTKTAGAPGFTWLADVAINMKGEIVANAITTGVMSADRIQGGTLTLGGNGNGNGVLKIVNASGTEIGRWDKDGISITQGSINIANKFSVNSSGYLTAISGKIAGIGITEHSMHTGGGDNGIWIYPPYNASTNEGNSHYPNGGIVIGEAGIGLIQIGYRHDGINVIRLEYGDTVRYIDWTGVHT